MLGENDGSASIADLSLQRRGRSGRDKEARKRTQEARGGDIKFRFVFIEMLIATLAGGEMHEVPGKERIGQRHIGVNARGCKRVAIEVNTFFEIASFGNAPIARQGMVTDIGEE